MKTAKVVLSDVKAPDDWGQLIETLGLPEAQSRKFFDFGEYASLELEIDSNLKVVGGRVLLRGRRAMWPARWPVSAREKAIDSATGAVRGFSLVIVESPYAGDVERNLVYVRACMADCLSRGEAPFASHALYTQPGVLRDEIPADRKLGIAAGLAWGAQADLTVVYTDLGLTPGMQAGINAAKALGRPVAYRQLGGEWESRQPDLFATLPATADEHARAVRRQPPQVDPIKEAIWGRPLTPKAAP